MQEVAERFEVLGVQVDCLDMDGAISSVELSIAGGRPGYVVFCTASTILEAHDDEEVRDALENAALVAPDGMPIVWLGRRVSRGVERVYGPDLMMDFLETTTDRYSHYFFGATDRVLQLLEHRLKKQVPKLRIVGAHSPGTLSLEDLVHDADIAKITAARPDVLWIGLGHPKQELWMHEAAGRLNGVLALGVGAAFDFHAGTKKEAPMLMKRLGLQWLHRLAMEPTRLWRRYLIGNARFLWLLARHRLGKAAPKRQGD